MNTGVTNCWNCNDMGWVLDEPCNQPGCNAPENTRAPVDTIDYEVDADNKNRQRDEELHALAKFVYARPTAPSELHDLAARILGEPSLAHGAWQGARGI